VTALFFGLYVLLARHVSTIGPSSVPLSADGYPDPAGLFSVQLAFGQVFTGFVAIFLASAVAVYVIQEFRQSQERPSLRLEIEPASVVLDAEPERADKTKVQIRLVNGGPLVAVWYQVRISLPFALLPSELWSGDKGPFRSLGGLKAIAGTLEGNWKWCRMSDRGEVDFFSAGRIAAYPGHPLVLFELLLPVGDRRDQSGTHVFDYSIATERVALSPGSLKLSVG
jgi:hypothetical protein